MHQRKCLLWQILIVSQSVHDGKLNDLDAEAAAEIGANSGDTVFLVSQITEGLLLLLGSNVSVPCLKGDVGAVQSTSKVGHSTIRLSEDRGPYVCVRSQLL